ncbi:hypothetical protein BU16DRAFT_531495 [Lophium mytilinum]|uniref:Phosphatidylserine decarboxylase n=1 Tax=Lophium mytilinum TaxID=390894 RepID=A0A6A6QAD2_9PEZI|nr:hypothetical protein BU16DRAFT_531495 [Lophium mytilinum]
MASQPPNPTQEDSSTLDHAGWSATASALNGLTDAAANHSSPPEQHLHAPGDQPSSHAWLVKHFPTAATTATLEKLEAKFHMGNYVIDRATGQKTFEAMSVYVRIGMHLLYYGSTQEKALHWSRTLELLKEQSEKMGREYDSPESKAHIQPFIDSFGLQDSMKDMVVEDPMQYPTFNEFFAREIKEAARPVAAPGDEGVTSSVADCRLTAFQTVDLATKYWIKGFGFSIPKLVGSEELARQFDGGSIVIARLAPQDYHRWHAPVDGTVEQINEIPGTYYTVNPQAINEPGTLDVFCENRRSVMTLRRSSTGAPIAIIAVGAMLVGSIQYVPASKIGAEVKRGQCLGRFLYGGSTVIVLYPKGEVVLDEDLVKNSVELGCETQMKVGWSVGRKQ